MATITSPLRYPGGKSGLSPFLADILESNGLIGSCFIEPFGGGAGAALNLLATGIVRRIVINDIDPAIASIWKSILYYTEGFIRLLNDTDINVEQWRKFKHIYRSPKEHSTLTQGFAAFYLNRTNRSGVLTANPIGGINQTGKWKIDARFNKNELTKRIEFIANMKNSICVREQDAIELLQEISTWSETKFIYLDPPYYNKGSDLYLNFYRAQDHEALASYLSRQQTFPWLATYDDAEPIRWLYRHCNTTNYKLNYHVTKWKTGTELCITPPEVITPENKLEFSYSKSNTRRRLFLPT